MTYGLRHGLGALPTPPGILATARPVSEALGPSVAAPALYHSALCDVHGTVDQNGYGACVAASGDYVESDQIGERAAHIDYLQAYARIKGLKWPIPSVDVEVWDPSPGLYPSQLWTWVEANGWPMLDGSARARAASALLVGRPSSSAAFLDAFQQTVLQLGPAQFTASWPANWFSTDALGYMRPPSGSAGGHAFEACGWQVWGASGCPRRAGCRWDSFHHQSWGAFGHDPDYRDHFRVHSPDWDALGSEAWKVVAQPGGSPMIPYAPDVPATPWDQIVDLKAGTVITSASGARVPLTSGGAGIASPFATTTTARAVRFSTGGIVQLGTVPLTSCSNMRPRVPATSPCTQADLDAARSAGYASAKANAAKAVGGI